MYAVGCPFCNPRRPLGPGRPQPDGLLTECGFCVWQPYRSGPQARATATKRAANRMRFLCLRRCERVSRRRGAVPLKSGRKAAQTSWNRSTGSSASIASQLHRRVPFPGASTPLLGWDGLRMPAQSPLLGRVRDRWRSPLLGWVRGPSVLHFKGGFAGPSSLNALTVLDLTEATPRSSCSRQAAPVATQHSS